jgi:hypothetical protein
MSSPVPGKVVEKSAKETWPLPPLGGWGTLHLRPEGVFELHWASLARPSVLDHSVDLGLSAQRPLLLALTRARTPAERYRILDAAWNASSSPAAPASPSAAADPLVLLDVMLEESVLTDISALVDTCIAMPWLAVRALKLWKNGLRDDSAVAISR